MEGGSKLNHKYIKSNLNENEKIIVYANINSLILILPKLIIPFFFILALCSTDFSNQNIGYEVAIIYLIIIFISLKSLFKTIIDILSTELGLTEKRIIGKRGLIKTISLDAPLNKINDIEINQNLFGKIFRYSTIKISTSSSKYCFRYIKNANEFKNETMKLL